MGKQEQKNKFVVSEPTYSHKRNKGVCVWKNCTEKLKKPKKYRFCYKHLRQHQRETNPYRYYYDHLKQNAKRRGKQFDLSIEDFIQFCEAENYLQLKGKFKGSATIDRIRQEEGYHKDNIQVLTRSQNARKYYIDLKIQFGYYPTEEELEDLYRKDSMIEFEPPKTDENMDFLNDCSFEEAPF